ncbi:hypothetical protein BDZ45DRAFT_806462 [Acephala macrosclerotiorum]|nr:hypothetical protein BDZ45DRAFT_806462 [Acephala macrosclerotiorum]
MQLRRPIYNTSSFRARRGLLLRRHDIFTIQSPRPDIRERILQMVQRDGDHLTPVKNSTQGLVSCMPDFVRFLSDLLAPTPKLLNQKHV